MNKLHILTTYDQIKNLRDYLKSEKQHVKSICAYDTESTGRSPHKESIIGFSISIYNDEGFYIPFKTWTDDDGLCTEAPAAIPKEGQNVTQTLHDAISPASLALAIDMLRDLVEWRTIMHNAPYDVIITKCNYGIDLTNTVYSDTMLKKHTVNSDRPHGLKDCGVLYIGEGANDEQLDLKDSVIRNGGKWNKQDKWIWRGDLKKVGLYACFEEKSSIVSMEDGSAKYIEDVKVGDYVLTHKGRPRRVYATNARDFDGDIYNFTVENGRKIRNVTGEHPFYTFNERELKYEWVKAKDLLPNHLLVKPDLEASNPEVGYSDDFMWLLGLYLADGYIRIQGNSRYPVFTQHQKEVHVVKSVLDKLGYKYSEVKKRNSKAVDIVVTDSALGTEILHLCDGKDICYGKKMGKEMFNKLLGSRHSALTLIAGILDGDGYIRKMKHRPDAFQLKLTSTSKSLITQVNLLLGRHAINCSLSEWPSFENRSHRYELHMTRNAAGEVNPYLRIKRSDELGPSPEMYKRHVRLLYSEVEHKTTKVYNISVEEDETFISNGLITHNCKDTILTLQLESALDKPLDDLGLRSFYYEDLVIPLLKTSTIPMQMLGFPIDVDYFKKIKLDLQWQIKDLELQIYNEIKGDIWQMEQEVLNRDYPVRPGGRFGQTLMEYVGLEIPLNPKTGVFSTAKAVMAAWKPQALKHATEDQIKVVWFVTGECDKVPTEIFEAVQVQMFQEDNPGDLSPVNLNSGAQFAQVVFNKWDITSSKTSRKTGAASFDAAVIIDIAKGRIQEQFSLSPAEAEEQFDEYMEADILPKDADWFVKYLRVRKLEKLLSNYVEGILDLQVNGVIYTNMNQAGTTSGRYASSNPNMQNLPAHSALGKMIKQGFISEGK